MKKVAVLILCLAASGCSGLEKHAEDTFWPFGDPNAPKSESENFRRVRGESVMMQPLTTQQGDVWPGQPDAVPTIKDVNDPNSRFSRSFREASAKNQLSNGEFLSVGEKVSTEKGVQRRSMASEPGRLPSSVSDRAQHYLEGPNRDNVAIPNGDGTTTIVAPNGLVRVVRGDPSVAMQSLNASAQKAITKNKSTSSTIKTPSRKRVTKPQQQKKIQHVTHRRSAAITKTHATHAKKATTSRKSKIAARHAVPHRSSAATRSRRVRHTPTVRQKNTRRVSTVKTKKVSHTAKKKARTTKKIVHSKKISHKTQE